jgi:hypothetical protein
MYDLSSILTDPRHHFGPIEEGFNKLDLAYMIGKERELYIVVVAFSTLDHQLPRFSASQR